MEDLIQVAQSAQDYVVSVRRELHQIPEIRWTEAKTLEHIEREVHAIFASQPDRQFIIRKYKGGLVVDININSNFDRILFRADVDALPIEEATGLPFASKNAGVMHACGHDIHSAMLLGFLKAIASNDVKGVNHNFRLVWQRAEENPITESGGACLVKEGVLKGVSEAHAQHIWASGKSGLFQSRAGRLTANSDRMKIEIRATGGHVAMPHYGSNALDIAIDIALSFRGFPLRVLGPNEPVSLVAAVLKAGEGSNVRPASAEQWFAVRNFLGPQERQRFHDALTAQVKSVTSLYPKASAEVSVVYGHPMMSNSPASFEKMNDLLRAAGQETAEIEAQHGGEDFAWYLESQGGVPGSMWFLGANQEGCGDHHTPTFNPDESVFWRGVLFWLLLATHKRFFM